MTDTNFELEPEKEYPIESFNYVLCEKCGHMILTKPDACYFCPQCHQRGGACE